MGDGIMAAFDSAYQAVGAATQIQCRRCMRVTGGKKHALDVRIGAPAGEPVTDHARIRSARRWLSRPLGCAPALSRAEHSRLHRKYTIFCRGKEDPLHGLGPGRCQGVLMI